MRWHRSEASNNPVLLLRRAARLEDTSIEGQRHAARLLELFYGWTNLDVPGLDRSHWERQALFDKVGALSKRSIEEVERNLQTNLQTEKENKRSKEDWQGLVKNDNQRAKDLVGAAASGDTEALYELQQYRQCSNCTHVSQHAPTDTPTLPIRVKGNAEEVSQAACFR